MCYYYCSKIREMMKLSKEEDSPQIYTINDEAIFIKYCKEFDDFMLQYSWNITDKNIHLQQEVIDVINELHKSSYEESQLDVIQIGLLSLYGSNEENLCGLIDICRNYKIQEINDTSYIFCGNKVLRILQYFDMVRYPIQQLQSNLRWNMPYAKCSEMTKLIKGVEYDYSKKQNNILFSVGSSNVKTHFRESVVKNIPQLILIDNFLGIKQYDITSNNK